MEEIFQFIENLNKRLARGIKDLDDVRGSMAALSEIRESEIRLVLKKIHLERVLIDQNQISYSGQSQHTQKMKMLTKTQCIPNNFQK